MKRSPVYLRVLKSEDCFEYITLMKQSRRLHARWVNPPRTPAEFKKFIKRASDPTFRSLVLCRKNDLAIVGTFNLSQITLANFLREFEIKLKYTISDSTPVSLR